MNSGSFKNKVTNYSFVNNIYVLYICINNFASNKQQGLICHEKWTKLPTKHSLDDDYVQASFRGQSLITGLPYNLLIAEERTNIFMPFQRIWTQIES